MAIDISIVTQGISMGWAYVSYELPGEIDKSGGTLTTTAGPTSVDAR
jgi:hypothetical protein